MSAIDDAVRNMRALQDELSQVNRDIKTHNSIDYNVKITGMETIKTDLDTVSSQLEDIPRRVSASVADMSTQLVSALKEINSAGNLNNVSGDLEKILTNLEKINQQKLQINADNIGDIQNSFKEIATAMGHVKKEVDSINSGSLNNLSNSMKSVIEQIPTMNQDMQAFVANIDKFKDSQQQLSLSMGLLTDNFKSVGAVSKELEQVLKGVFELTQSNGGNTQVFDSMNTSISTVKDTMEALQNAMNSGKISTPEGVGGATEEIQRIKQEVNKLKGDVTSSVAQMAGTSIGDISKFYGNIATMSDDTARMTKALESTIKNMHGVSEDAKREMMAEVEQLRSQSEDMSTDVSILLNNTISKRLQRINDAIDAGESSILNQMSNGYGLSSQYTRGLTQTGNAARKVWQQSAAMEQLTPKYKILGMEFGQLDMSDIKKNSSALAQMQYEYQQGRSDVDRLFATAKREEAKGNYAARDDALKQAKDRFQSLVELQERMNQRAHSLGERWSLMSEKDKARLGKEGKEIEKNIKSIVSSTRKNNVHLLGMKEAYQIDVPDKKLKNIQKQTKELGKLSEAVEDTGKKSDSAFKKILDNSNSVIESITSALSGFKRFIGGFGIGSLLLGPLDTMIKANDYHREQGRDRYQSMGIDAYVGVTDLADSAVRAQSRLMEGDSLYRASGGMIDRKAINQQYNAWMKNIGGHYGASGAQAAADMDRLSRDTALMKNVYGIDDSTMQDVIKTYYKEMNMSVDETEQALAKLSQSAQAANVPMNQYLKMITSIANKFMAIGIDGARADAVMGNLIARGMRAEVAQEITLQLTGAMSKFAEDKGQVGFAAMMNGSDPWHAIAQAGYTHEADGSVRKGWADEIATGMDTMFNLYMGVYGDNPDMRRMGATDQLRKMGFNQRAASTLASAYLSGNKEQFKKLLAEETEKKDNPNATLEELNEQIKDQLVQMTDQLSSADTLQATMDSMLYQSAEKIGSAIDQIIEVLSPILIGFQEGMLDMLGGILEFVDKLVDSELFETMVGGIVKVLEHLPELIAVGLGISALSSLSDMGLPSIGTVATGVGVAAAGAGAAYLMMDDKTREQAWNTIKDFGGSALDFGKSALGTVGDWISDWWNDGSSEENKPKPESESKGGFLDMVSGMVFGKAEASPKKNDKDKTTDTIIKVKDKLVKDNKEIEKYIDTLENQLDEYKQEQANLVKELADSGENADDKKEIADALAACADKIKTTNNRIGELKEQQASNTTQLQEQADALGIDIKEFTSATKDSIIEKVDENSAATNKFIEKKHQQSNEIYKKLSSIVGKDLAEKIVTAGDHILYTDILGFGSLSEIIEKIFDMTNQLLEKAGVKKYSLLQGDGFGAKFLRGGLRLAASGVGIFSDTGASLLRGTANINEFDGMDATTATLFGGLETYAAGSVQKAIEYLSGDSGFIEWAAAQGITMAMLHSKTYEDIKRMVAKYQKERATMREKVQNGDYIPDSEKTAYTYELYRREAAKKLKTAKASGDQEAIKKAQEELRINELAAQSGGDIVGARQKFEKEQAEKVANGGKDLGDRAKDAMDQTVDTAKEYGEKATNMAFGTAEAASSEDRPETKAESERSREKTTGDATKKITDQQKKEQELSKQRNKQLEDMAELHERLMGMFQASVKEEHGNLWKMMAITQDILVDMKATVARAGAFVATAAQTGGSGGNAGIGNTDWNKRVVYERFKKAGYSDEYIAGVMGRLQQEHNFDTSDVAEHWENGLYVGGYGMFQLNGSRTTRFLNWCKEKGLDPHDPGAQTDFALIEMQERGLTPDKVNHLSAADAATHFTDKYEVGKHGSERTYALDYLQAIKNNSGWMQASTPAGLNSDAKGYIPALDRSFHGFDTTYIDTSYMAEDLQRTNPNGMRQDVIRMFNALAKRYYELSNGQKLLITGLAEKGIHSGDTTAGSHGQGWKVDIHRPGVNETALAQAGDEVGFAIGREDAAHYDLSAYDFASDPNAIGIGGQAIGKRKTGILTAQGTVSNIAGNMAGNMGATIEQYEQMIKNGSPDSKDEYHRRAQFAMSNHAAQIQYTGKRDASILDAKSADAAKDTGTSSSKDSKTDASSNEEKKKTYKILDSDKELEAAEYLKYYGVSTGNLDESTIEKLADRLQRTHSLDENNPFEEKTMNEYLREHEGATKDDAISHYLQTEQGKYKGDLAQIPGSSSGADKLPDWVNSKTDWDKVFPGISSLLRTDGINLDQANFTRVNPRYMNNVSMYYGPGSTKGFSNGLTNKDILGMIASGNNGKGPNFDYAKQMWNRARAIRLGIAPSIDVAQQPLHEMPTDLSSVQTMSVRHDKFGDTTGQIPDPKDANKKIDARVLDVYKKTGDEQVGVRVFLHANVKEEAMERIRDAVKKALSDGRLTLEEITDIKAMESVLGMAVDTASPLGDKPSPDIERVRSE